MLVRLCYHKTKTDIYMLFDFQKLCGITTGARIKQRRTYSCLVFIRRTHTETHTHTPQSLCTIHLPTGKPHKSLDLGELFLCPVI